MDADADRPPERSSGGGRGPPQWLPKAAFESALIVFSIFLGLALNNWNQERETARRVQEARAFFAEEIRSNCKTLASSRFLPHHRRLLKLAAGPDAIAAATETGVHPMMFRDAVWRSVAGGDLIEHMDQREVFALTETYGAQAELSAINRAMYPILLGADPEREPARVARSLRLYLGDVTAIEGELLHLYDAMLSKLEPRKHQPCA